MGEYGYPERRKTRKDKKRKKRHGVYKRGGRFRSSKTKESANKK